MEEFIHLTEGKFKGLTFISSYERSSPGDVPHRKPLKDHLLSCLSTSDPDRIRVPLYGWHICWLTR